LRFFGVFLSFFFVLPIALTLVEDFALDLSDFFFEASLLEASLL
jgi:hypothetical protein